MKKAHFILVILCFFAKKELVAQTVFQNEGTIQMHDGASIGFHVDLENNGKFNEDESVEKKGFVGFYSDNETRKVLGDYKPIFYDVDVVTFNSNLELEVSVEVRNDLNFVEGKVITPRNNTGISLDFNRHRFIGGQSDERHVDGYVSVIGNETFSFPIGHNDRLRPMILPDYTTNNFYKGAYFFENPNTPSTFNTNFETSSKDSSLKNISKQEFWDLNGTTETNITLTWDGQSNIISLATDIKNLRVVGWNKAENMWEDLGNTNVSGSFDAGKITSVPFIPNNYEIITIGSTNESGISPNPNYLISPNKDDVNDNLIIDGLEKYKHNRLSIYNRWGILVYRMLDYSNQFRGFSQGRASIRMQEGLPTGVYFYMVEYGNTTKYGKQQKGWVYINP